MGFRAKRRFLVVSFGHVDYLSMTAVVEMGEATACASLLVAPRSSLSCRALLKALA